MKMKEKVIVVLFLLASICYGQENKYEGDNLIIENSQVYLSMVHTPNGHILQRAPYKTQTYEHLVLGAGPETVYYKFVKSIQDFYNIDFPNEDINQYRKGKVVNNGIISITIEKPKESELSELPTTLTSNKKSVKYAAVVLAGETNKPCFSNSDSKGYWLRAIINKPIELIDGKMILAFSKMELAINAYFTDDCIIDGEYMIGDIKYIVRNMEIKKGWNVIGLIWGEDSDIFKGARYLVNISKKNDLYNVSLVFCIIQTT